MHRLGYEVLKAAYLKRPFLSQNAALVEMKGVIHPGEWPRCRTGRLAALPHDDVRMLCRKIQKLCYTESSNVEYSDHLIVVYSNRVHVI